MRMMDAIVKPAAAPGLELRQVPVPVPGPGEVLIKIHKTAICGTDVHIYDWNEWSAQHVKPPMVIGHEYVGEIAEMGPGVTGLEIGQRVSGEGHITCGHCRNCHNGNIQWCKDTISVGVDRDGAFAEYVCIPASNVIRIDPSLDEDVVAMFDAVGNATHTALMFNLVGEDVLITGAGPIGVLATAICKYAGARRVIVTDLNDYRLALAHKMGADAVVNTGRDDLEEAMRAQGLVEGFDVGLEMSGSGAALKQMLSVMRNGGKISLLGLGNGPINLDMNLIIGKGLTLQGIYGRKLDNWHQMSYMVQGGLDLTPAITHRFHYTEFEKGYAQRQIRKSNPGLDEEIRRQAMKTAFEQFQAELDAIREAGTYREERIITTPQRSRIDTTKANGVVNMCANNYLGLSDNPRLIAAAKASYDKWGFGLSSVRFICGTQEIHKELERKIADFVGMEDAILYSSCFDANGGLFEVLLGAEDAIISDELNHASIIDGVRLCKAKRYRYKNNDMDDLKKQLEDARATGCKRIMIATDGVFSMDGYIANLKGICDLADEYDALVMVDDSHAVGFMGEHGRGTPEYCGVMGRVDILTGTFGKAMGGASGGYTASKKEVVDLLRQKSRPYLFSNSLAPAICAATIETINMLNESTALRDKVHENANYFRAGMEKLGFDLLPGEHPIVPVMLYDPKVANEFASRMLEKGVYVVGFCYPVVPKGRDRVRTQISAGHTKEDLDFAIKCFGEVKKEMGI